MRLCGIQSKTPDYSETIALLHSRLINLLCFPQPKPEPGRRHAVCCPRRGPGAAVGGSGKGKGECSTGSCTIHQEYKNGQIGNTENNDQFSEG